MEPVTIPVSDKGRKVAAPMLGAGMKMYIAQVHNRAIRRFGKHNRVHAIGHGQVAWGQGKLDQSKDDADLAGAASSTTQAGAKAEYLSETLTTGSSGGQGTKKSDEQDKLCADAAGELLPNSWTDFRAV